MARPSVPDWFTGIWIHFELEGFGRSTTYERGVANGPFRRWLTNGVVSREGEYRNDQYHGDLITRGADGEVLDISRFENGTGTYRIFYSSGVLSREIPLVQGKKHGIEREWDGHGNLRQLNHYEHGRLISAEGPSEVNQ